MRNRQKKRGPRRSSTPVANDHPRNPTSQHWNRAGQASSQHLSRTLLCKYSRLRLSDHPCRCVRIPQLRIPPSHSWCGAIWVTPPAPPHKVRNSKSRPIHQPGAASGRLRPAPSLVREITSTVPLPFPCRSPESSCTIPAPAPLIKTTARFHHSCWNCFFAHPSNAPPLAYHYPNLPLPVVIPDALLLILGEAQVTTSL